MTRGGGQRWTVRWAMFRPITSQTVALGKALTGGRTVNISQVITHWYGLFCVFSGYLRDIETTQTYVVHKLLRYSTSQK